MVRALVADGHVDVFVHQSTDTCSYYGEFRHRAGCHTDDYRFLSFDPCPSHSCVRHIQLESNGSVLQSVDDAALAGFDFPTPSEGKLQVVIDTCDGSTTLDLPAPTTGPAPTFAQATGGVRVDANRESAGVFATDNVLFSTVHGYFSWCEADGPTTTVPVSDQDPDYWVTAFAYDDPVIVDRANLHAELFPATYVEGPLVENVDLGSAWALTVSAAKASSMYAPCADYCTASDDACGIDSSDVTDCATNCTLEGGLFPNCNEQYRALLLCLGNTPACGGRTTAATPSVCPDETAAYDQCAGQ